MRPVIGPNVIETRYRAHAAEMSTSPTYQDWASGIADDADVLAVLGTLPEDKQQANLVFAAARWHGVRPGPYEELRSFLLGPEWPTVRGTILARRTQTNEVGRLTALAPALAMLGDEPLALVELGASAGLCLFPDRFDYVWEGVGELRGSGGPTLSTRATGPLPVPSAHPRVAARIGIDLNPLDVTRDDDVAWLLQLVWPGHDDRRDRLADGIEVARAEPPRLLAGDMLDLLDGAVSAAAELGGIPVVHHSAAAAYLDQKSREQLQERMAAHVAAGRCHWISLEGPQVLPDLAVTAPPSPLQHGMCLAVDGRPVGWAQSHGTDLAWC